jgi:hypothetical protein
MANWMKTFPGCVVAASSRVEISNSLSIFEHLKKILIYKLLAVFQLLLQASSCTG